MSPIKSILSCLLVLGLAPHLLACGEYGGGQDSTGSAGSFSAVPSGISEAEMVASFESTLYPLLRSQTCEQCHSGGVAPFLITHPNPAVAYRAIVDNDKVNFQNPYASRLVGRLQADRHNCWSSCSVAASEMLVKIEEWIADIEARGGGTSGGTAVAPGTSLGSDTVPVSAGLIDEGSHRFETNLIAFWKFDEGAGTIARDTSGIPPAIDVDFGSDATFMASYGIEIQATRVTLPSATSRKLYDWIADPDTGSQQYTIEMWVSPSNTAQQEDMIRYSSNFRVRQNLYQYDFRNRSLAPGIDSGGSPALLTYDVDRDLKSGLHHAVLTYDQYSGRRIYVNGVFTDDVDAQGGGPLWTWSPTAALSWGDAADAMGNGGWYGQIRLVAIYNRALSQDLIVQNYLAGVGLRRKLEFDISQYAGPGVTLEVSLSQLDDESYLLCQPTIVGASSGLRVQGLRIQINGVTPKVGQAFGGVSTVIRSGRQQISDLCSIVDSDSAVLDDEFRITFEGLGGWVDPYVEAPPIPLTYDYTGVIPRPTNGVRDFARINESMAQLTGVDPADHPNTILSTYQTIATQLPNGYDARSFVAANQVGIAKLALLYCDAMIEDPGLRDAFFDQPTPFGWTDVPATAFFEDVSLGGSTDNRDLITLPLVEKMIGSNDSNQPDPVVTEADLKALIQTLEANCGGAACTVTDTNSIVKGVCTAVLASGAVVLH